MNPSDWNPLFVTLAGLGLSGVVVVVLAELVARRKDRAQTQRAVWIAAATLMLGLTLAEWFGVRAAVEPLWSRVSQPKTSPAVVTTVAATQAQPAPMPTPARVTSSVIVTAQPMVEVAMSSSRVAGWLSVAWLVGTALLLIRCGVALGLLPWVRRRLQPVRETELLSLAKDVRERLGMKQTPELRQGRVASPMTFGLFRPVVCLPEQFGVEFPAEQRRAVLAHEFAHVASLDTLWRCLGEVLAALLWWHPAVWVIRRRLHRACELAADEACRLVGPVQASLAEALVALAAKPGRVAPWPMLAAAGDGYHSDLGQRVERLLDSSGVPPALPKAGWRWSVGALLTAVVLMSGLSACHTGSESPIKQAGTVLRADQPSVPPPTEGKPQSSSASLRGIYDVTGTTVNNEARETDLRKDLITRTFKVDPNEFVHGLSNFMAMKEDARKVDEVSQLNFMEAIKEASGRPRDFHGVVRGYFTVAGVDLSPPKAIHFNDRTGLLMVSAAATDLDRVKKAIDALDTAPNRVPSTNEIGPSSTVPEVLKTNSVSQSETASKGEDPPKLITRTFKVDPNTFVMGLGRVMGTPVSKRTEIAPNTFHDMAIEGVDALGLLKTYLLAAGLELIPPKAVFFNDRNGLILVRATAEDVELFQSALDLLNTAPPQVALETRWIEVTEEAMKVLQKEWPVLRPYPTADPDRSGETLAEKFREANPSAAVESVVSEKAAILTPEQALKLLKSMEGTKGATIVTTPKVTTLSGRQAQVAMLDLKTVVTGVAVTNAPGETADITYHTTAMPFGPTCDLIPYVARDGFTIDLTVIATDSEFIGYDDPKQFVPERSVGKGEPIKGMLPLPRLRSRYLTSTARVWDGQWLLLGGLKAEENTEVKTVFGFKRKQKVNKHLFLLVTPTIIDPAGNRVHSDEEMAKAQKASQ